MFIERASRSDRERTARRESGILFGSGLVGGEGLLGVGIAGVVFYQSVGAAADEKRFMPFEIGRNWAGDLTTQALGVGLFVLLALVFAHCCKAKSYSRCGVRLECEGVPPAAAGANTRANRRDILDLRARVLAPLFVTTFWTL